MDDCIAERMGELARQLIGEYFFDPDREDAYKTLMGPGGIGTARPDGATPVVLSDLEAGPCRITLLALRTLLTFRVRITGPSLDISIEGAWSFQTESLLRPHVSIERGAPAVIAPVLQTLCHDLAGDTLDDEEYHALMDSLEDEP
jgi:hypothetical protein